VIGLSAAGLVEIYNERESKLAGLSPSMVMGANFFLTIAQCMNNFMVAQRFLDEPELDATIDFVLTFRMRPTPVQLRMLQSASARRHYVLIAR
jgi:photoactive yellow protein